MEPAIRTHPYQQHTSLLTTGRGSGPDHKATTKSPTPKKDRLLAFQLPPGVFVETHKYKEYICELSNNENMELSSKCPLDPPDSLRESTGRHTWFWKGWVLFYPPSHNQGQDQQNRAHKHIVQIDEKCWNMLVWDEQEFGGERRGLTQECTVHNPLIQICKKIAF